MEKIKIILVDDHQMFRDGVKSVLSDEKILKLLVKLEWKRFI